jgi:tRNA (cmo5U34)-methyltransferase
MRQARRTLPPDNWFRSKPTSPFPPPGLLANLRLPAVDCPARVKPLTSQPAKLPFSFANYAEDFDRHIELSIRGYGNLIEDCVELSQYFVENGTVVCDIGCSTGRMLAAIRSRNHERAPAARYIGLDVEPGFQRHWAQVEGANIRFMVQDVLAFRDFVDLSLATSIFTLQFLPERHRREVCRKIFEGLVPGGAFIVAEKTFTKMPKTQDMLTSLYLHYKRRHFSDEEILDKEKSLRDKMKLGREDDLIRLLTDAGFNANAIEPFWRSHMFGAYICVKW